MDKDRGHAPSSLYALLVAASQAERLPEGRPSGNSPTKEKIDLADQLSRGRGAGFVPSVPGSPANRGSSNKPTSPSCALGPASRAADFAKKCSRRLRRALPLKRERHPLPLVLMALLVYPGNKDVLTFLPDGKSFAILRPDAFAADLMPRHFGVTRYEAFVRKLGRWGFRSRPRKDEDLDAAIRESFYHPLFRRGEWNLCGTIRPQGVQWDAAASSQATLGGAPPMKKLDQSARRLALQRAQLVPATQQPSPVASLPQRTVDDATKAVVGAALDVLMWDRSNPKKNIGDGLRRPAPVTAATAALQRCLLPSDLAARTSELIATSACCGPTGLAKERIKAELLKSKSAVIGKELADVLRRRQPKNVNKGGRRLERAAVLLQATELANLGL